MYDNDVCDKLLQFYLISIHHNRNMQIETKTIDKKYKKEKKH